MITSNVIDAILEDFEKQKNVNLKEVLDKGDKYEILEWELDFIEKLR